MAKKGYKLKTHKDKDNRMVVFLLYLNKLDETGGSFEIYSKEGGVSNKNFKLEKQFQPEAGKLLVFLSNPLSYHNVSEILKSESKRFFCYGGYTSLNNIIWKIILFFYFSNKESNNNALKYLKFFSWIFIIRIYNSFFTFEINRN